MEFRLEGRGFLPQSELPSRIQLLRRFPWVLRSGPRRCLPGRPEPELVPAFSVAPAPWEQPWLPVELLELAAEVSVAERLVVS